MRELWAINVGTYAAQRKLVLYRGTKLGAIRRAKREWRKLGRMERVSVSRPGCAGVAYGQRGHLSGTWYKPTYVSGVFGSLFVPVERVTY